MCQSSCDSLLNGSSIDSGVAQKSRTATVQRAISEPSKKFNRLAVRQSPADRYVPRRAVSDETVDDHDYENVSIIRKTLAIQAAAQRRSQSQSQSSVSQSQSSVAPLSTSKSSLISESGSSLQVYPQLSSNPRKLSISSVNKLSSHAPETRYSLISTSPSMERLLIDYTPPPSYNEVHANSRPFYPLTETAVRTRLAPPSHHLQPPGRVTQPQTV